MFIFCFQKSIGHFVSDLEIWENTTVSLVFYSCPLNREDFPYIGCGENRPEMPSAHKLGTGEHGEWPIQVFR